MLRHNNFSIQYYGGMYNYSLGEGKDNQCQRFDQKARSGLTQLDGPQQGWCWRKNNHDIIIIIIIIIIILLLLLFYYYSWYPVRFMAYSFSFRYFTHHKIQEIGHGTNPKKHYKLVNLSPAG